MARVNVSRPTSAYGPCSWNIQFAAGDELQGSWGAASDTFASSGVGISESNAGNQLETVGVGFSVATRLKRDGWLHCTTLGTDEPTTTYSTASRDSRRGSSLGRAIDSVVAG